MSFVHWSSFYLARNKRKSLSKTLSSPFGLQWSNSHDDAPLQITLLFSPIVHRWTLIFTYLHPMHISCFCGFICTASWGPALHLHGFFSPLAAFSLRALMDVLLKITLLCSGERDFIFFLIMAEQTLIKNIVLFGQRSLGKPVFLAVIHSRTLQIWMSRLILLLGERWSFIFLLQGNILEFERNYSNFTSHILERITAFLSGDKPVRE